MNPVERDLDAVDRVVLALDRALHTLVPTAVRARRPNPAAEVEETLEDPAERARIAGLMRVNHSGEVCAQALYQGQALTARDPATRAAMAGAAEEENDHLAWCEQRLSELGEGPSLLNPLWYAGSFTIGALAGALGDRWSLGFLAETERQVVAHLEGHLDQLPEDDQRTRRIVEQMREDEARHGEHAMEAGGSELPSAVRELMELTARVMTTVAARI